MRSYRHGHIRHGAPKDPPLKRWQILPTLVRPNVLLGGRPNPAGFAVGRCGRCWLPGESGPSFLVPNGIFRNGLPALKSLHREPKTRRILVNTYSLFV